MRVEVVYREPDKLKAIHWNGNNADDVRNWLATYMRGYDYDNRYSIQNNTLYLGQYPLPACIWLVLDENIQDYTEREFYELFDLVPS